MANIPFTSNYTDLSSQRGYQFKFFCEKCGNGYMSTFQANRLGAAAAAANAAASLLGGIFGRAAQTADPLQSMTAGPQHDAALDAAVREISPLFKQCTRCGNWVCEPICWNKKAGLCERARRTWTKRSRRAGQAARDQAQKRRAPWTTSASGTSRRWRRGLPQLRRQDAGRQVLPRVRHLDRSEARVQTAAPRPTAHRSSARSAASPTVREVSDETRRAPAAFALTDAGGATTAQGKAEAVIGDDDLQGRPGHRRVSGR